MIMKIITYASLIIASLSVLIFSFFLYCNIGGKYEYKKKEKLLKSHGFKRYERKTPYLYGYRTFYEWCNNESMQSIEEQRVKELSFFDLIIELEDE